MKTFLKAYLTKIHEIYSHGDAREESYYSALEDLIHHSFQICGNEHLGITSMPRRTEGGNPDFRVWDGTAKIVGYIEAKRPDENLDDVSHSEQIQRYLKTFPNFILTNFLEFRCFRNGQEIDRVIIARQHTLIAVRAKPEVENEQPFRWLLEKFFSFTFPGNLNAQQLARELAKRTRFLRDQVVLEELQNPDENRENRLLQYFEAFQKFLINGLTLEEFANLFAQTVTYGLFAARTRGNGAFNRRRARDFIPRTIGILHDLFEFISLGQISPQLEWIVDDIAEVLSSVAVGKILDEFYKKGKGEDPIFYFYETFLAEYDPKMREKRGVYYTPVPVVGFIVRSLNRILKEHFGLKEGLGSPEAKVLDPAAGTMTFIAEAVKLALAEHEKKYGAGVKEDFIREQMLRNFFAFELMMAPYTIGHMKMAYILEELGYKMRDEDRFQLYLTNALEMQEIGQSNLPGISTLSQESREAGRIKKKESILVILGNPPYSGHSANASEKFIEIEVKKGKFKKKKVKTWIGDQIETYKFVDGKPLGERNPKWLQDDYVKFIRFAQWKIEQYGEGIVGMITNHSYFDNPTFRGMRQSLMKTFNEIYLLDLHGNAKKKEKCPDGSKDENVFDIQQGVAIALFLKKREGEGCKIFHSDLWGLREEKYDELAASELYSIKWQELDPKKEFYLFVSRDEARFGRYEKFIKITDIFPVNSVGIVTARDELTIKWSAEEAYRTVLRFAEMKPEDARVIFNLGKDARDWKVDLAQQDLKESGLKKGNIVPILYRPFDVRYTYYTGYSRGFHCRPRGEVMRNMLRKNIALITARSNKSSYMDHFFCTNHIMETKCGESTTQSCIFPLYLYPSLFPEDESGLSVNIPEKIINAVFPSPPTPLPPGEGLRVRAKLPEYILQLCREFRKHPTETENILWQCLRYRRLNGLKFRRQHPIGRYIADFFCHEQRLIVEVDGGIHLRKEQKEYDAERQESLAGQGYNILHVTTAEVKNDLEEVLKKIASFSPSPPTPLPEGEGLRERAESIFYYIYAVLYSNIYREKYAEFLKTDFPRLPFTEDKNLFREMAQLGKRLADLHLMKSPELEDTFSRFEVAGSNMVQKVVFVPPLGSGAESGKKKRGKGVHDKIGKVFINDSQYFSEIPEQVWEYQIGGYQVMQKWLKDRKGRRLSNEDIHHYMKVARALQLTSDIQKEIDELYPQVEKSLINI